MLFFRVSSGGGLDVVDLSMGKVVVHVYGESESVGGLAHVVGRMDRARGGYVKRGELGWGAWQGIGLGDVDGDELEAVYVNLVKTVGRGTAERCGDTIDSMEDTGRRPWGCPT